MRQLNHQIQYQSKRTDIFSKYAILQTIEYGLMIVDMINAYHIPPDVNGNTFEDSIKASLLPLMRQLNGAFNDSWADKDSFRFALAGTIKHFKQSFPDNHELDVCALNLNNFQPKLSSDNEADKKYIEEYRALHSLPKASYIDNKKDPTLAFSELGPINFGVLSGQMGAGKTTTIKSVVDILNGRRHNAEPIIQVLANTEGANSHDVQGAPIKPMLQFTMNKDQVESFEKKFDSLTALSDGDEAEDGQSAGCACCAGLKAFIANLQRMVTKAGNTQYILADLMGIADADVLRLFLHQVSPRLMLPSCSARWSTYVMINGTLCLRHMRKVLNHHKTNLKNRRTKTLIHSLIR